MSFSKIFSGDLPEITYYIIKNFQNDFSTLHSCILINRFLCRLAIPLLWENPFSIKFPKNYHFIEIYLHNLNDDDKTKLNKYRIYDKLLIPSNTLFNYPSFIKYLDTRKIISSTIKWSKDITRTLIKLDRFLLMDIYVESGFMRLIQTSIFKILIENEINLHTLGIEIFYFQNYDSYQDYMLKIILQNRNSIHNVRSLKLYIDNTSNVYEKYTYVENIILQIINIHQNHKKIVLVHNNFPLFQSLLSSKDVNYSNILNKIILYEVNFNGEINLDKIFEQLNVLESVHIIYCSSLNISFIQQIINLDKPFKLKSLFIDGRSQIDESLKLLLQKSGDYLENFGCKSSYSLLLEQQILNNIIIYCKNIKFLGLYEFKDQIDYLSIDLIENIKQNLNYLSINVKNLLDNDINSGSIILRKLSQALPFKLKYLSLNDINNLIGLEIFLKNSQNTFIEKLLISSTMKGDSMTSYLPYIKEYITKEKRIEYLAITNTYYTDIFRMFKLKREDLFSLKNEVKEFKLYNIEIRYYNELFIKVHEFIKEMD